MANWKEVILHLKRKLEKGVGADKTLHILHKLHKVPITVELLQETGIGKVINSLKKQEGDIGDRARTLVGNWKQIVQDEQGPVKNNSPSKTGHQNKHSKNASLEEHYNSKHHHLTYENCKYDSSDDRGNNYYSQHQEEDYVNGSARYESEHPGHSPGSYNPHFSRDDYKSYRSSFSTQSPLESYSYTPTSTKQKEHKTKEDSEKNKHRHKESSKKERIMREAELVNSQSSQKHSTSKSHSSDSVVNSPKKKSKQLLKKSSTADGFNNSLCSFEACLGLNDSVKLKKKKPSTSPSVPILNNTKSAKPEQEECLERASSEAINVSKSAKKSSKVKRKVDDQKIVVPADLKKPKLVPLEEVNVLSTLPEIQPNYKPLRHKMPDSPPHKKKLSMSNEEAIIYTSSRKEKTAVYAGRRNNYLSEVPTLFDACVKVLLENIDGLAYTGGVPYDLLKAVLEKCQPAQLYALEDYNPYLLEDTDELWHLHCQRDFKIKNPGEDETWRELYLRSHDEREEKLKNITANISASMAKATPVRQTKLAYVDSVAKPPREVLRKQVKHGTGLPVATPMRGGPSSKATPRPVAPFINSANSSSSTSSAQPKKPKVAPLMQKTLKFMKQRFRR